LYVNNSTAEMIKYTSNSYFAMLISFSNEISNICDKLDCVDAMNVMKGLYLDGRISPLVDSKRITPGSVSYLKPGCGYGGSCFPKDVKTLASFSDNLNIDAIILKATLKVNEEQPSVILEKIYSHYSSVKSLKVGVLGLAFKPETDDIRESPSIKIISKLLTLGSIVHTYDPKATKEVLKVFPEGDISFHKDMKSVVSVSDVIVVLTAWEEFNNLPKLLQKKNKDTLVIDGRRIFDPLSFNKYEGIGYNA